LGEGGKNTRIRCNFSKHKAFLDHFAMLCTRHNLASFFRPHSDSDWTIHSKWNCVQADCVISLAKGEGWGQIPREAWARGVPTIISDIPAWEDVPRRDGKLFVVASRGKLKATYGFTSEDTGSFLEPDFVAAQKVMKDVHRILAGRARKPPVLPGPVSWEKAGEVYRRELNKTVIVFAKVRRETRSLSRQLDLQIRKHAFPVRRSEVHNLMF
jgi:hypothetical protein